MIHKRRFTSPARELYCLIKFKNMLIGLEQLPSRYDVLKKKKITSSVFKQRRNYYVQAFIFIPTSRYFTDANKNFTTVYYNNGTTTITTLI